MGYGLTESSPPAIEQIKRRCEATASQMQCPLHQKSAKVDVQADDFDSVSVEIFTCCDEFLNRVRNALKDIPSR
jgi:hypothetical protein